MRNSSGQLCDIYLLNALFVFIYTTQYKTFSYFYKQQVFLNKLFTRICEINLFLFRPLVCLLLWWYKYGLCCCLMFKIKPLTSYFVTKSFGKTQEDVKGTGSVKGSCPTEIEPNTFSVCIEKVWFHTEGEEERKWSDLFQPSFGVVVHCG